MDTFPLQLRRPEQYGARPMPPDTDSSASDIKSSVWSLLSDNVKVLFATLHFSAPYALGAAQRVPLRYFLPISLHWEEGCAGVRTRNARCMARPGLRTRTNLFTEYTQSCVLVVLHRGLPIHNISLANIDAKVLYATDSEGSHTWPTEALTTPHEQPNATHI